MWLEWSELERPGDGRGDDVVNSVWRALHQLNAGTTGYSRGMVACDGTHQPQDIGEAQRSSESP
jgi:hypothetical protein